jgi:hypothetical protein
MDDPNTAQPIPQSLISEIAQLQQMCEKRYKFNSFWDNVMILLGLAVSLGIVASGLYNRSHISAMLGGLVTAIVTAQRAFPFNQRWQFYRNLDGQAQNLLTEARNGVINLEQAITTLKALRLDFAQQIPRGSSTRSDGAPDSEAGTPDTAAKT